MKWKEGEITGLEGKIKQETRRDVSVIKYKVWLKERGYMSSHGIREE